MQRKIIRYTFTILKGDKQMIKKLKVLLLSTMLTVGVVGCAKDKDVSTEKENVIQ